MRSAFRLYLAAAKSSDSRSQLSLGNLYDAGTGVCRNRVATLYWYKRAYRRGLSSAAGNTRIMWRNEKKTEMSAGVVSEGSPFRR